MKVVIILSMIALIASLSIYFCQVKLKNNELRNELNNTLLSQSSIITHYENETKEWINKFKDLNRLFEITEEGFNAKNKKLTNEVNSLKRKLNAIASDLNGYKVYVSKYSTDDALYHLNPNTNKLNRIKPYCISFEVYGYEYEVVYFFKSGEKMYGIEEEFVFKSKEVALSNLGIHE